MPADGLPVFSGQAFARFPSCVSGAGTKGAIVRGVLMPGGADSTQDAVCRAELLDFSGRNVLDLKPGENDVSRLAPGVYFYRLAAGDSTATRKMVKAE